MSSSETHGVAVTVVMHILAGGFVAAQHCIEALAGAPVTPVSDADQDALLAHARWAVTHPQATAADYQVDLLLRVGAQRASVATAHHMLPDGSDPGRPHPADVCAAYRRGLVHGMLAAHLGLVQSSASLVLN